MRQTILLFVLIGLVILISGCNQKTELKDNNKGDALESFVGQWSGQIDIPNQPLPIIVSFQRENALKGKISIPVQGIKDYPLSNVKTNKDAIDFTMKIQDQIITFKGKLASETISGTFTQNGQSFPFELIRGAEASKKEEEVGEFISVETPKGTLYGELELPEGNGPFPLMIIIPGSGPTDRNGNTAAGDNNSLKMLAKELADNGIASVRYDKRGAGKNMEAIIPEDEIRFEQFVEDGIAWETFLKKDNRFTKLGIIGHSQGSLVGMLAAQRENVDLFISIAGPGRSIDEVMYDQLKEQLPENLLKESKDILTKLKQEEYTENVSQELQSLFRPSMQPFLASWIGYNPAKEIAKLDIPILLINGKNDVQVSEHEAEILQKANREAELQLIDNMNHVLKEAPTDREGNIATYFNPDLPLATGLMDEIISFTKNHGF